MTKTEGTYAPPFKARYDNFIGGRYFDNVTPITDAVVTKVARSDDADVELALDAAHAAKEAWAKTSAAERSNTLLKIANQTKENLALVATADIPPAVNHFRYFAGLLRSKEGNMSEINANTVAYHFHERWSRDFGPFFKIGRLRRKTI